MSPILFFFYSSLLYALFANDARAEKGVVQVSLCAVVFLPWFQSQREKKSTLMPRGMSVLPQFQTIFIDGNKQKREDFFVDALC